MGNTFIGLLRGINVSGQKKIKMRELSSILEATGLKNLKTYIQSGNIVFESDEADREKLQEVVTHAIHQRFGFDVPTLVIKKEDVKAILEANPFAKESEENKLYYVLLKTPSKEELVNQFNQLHFEHEGYQITNQCVYLLCKNGYGRAKLNNNLIENKLKVEATTRNHKTMLKLLEMASVKG
ncbi:DUF1697 domain-containing protein [Flagellimonas halotolerans]|uniref:DUF1697 domain-containing protein n=1 Tax=Flagellimonas halotolerans TaxID=3112164 RepID=A0ABU6IP11_9FLAO|nr:MULTISPECIES: DUF1697 domain-containing protein [unclassified Allomuricauda]MEC3964898.1 DUF1697 domain-containing protein [Muricauda sp. SYSU M86414]MEC4264738.1 DUF1697 domain-containing protein [Muricauda sp. SYSU M84420]